MHPTVLVHASQDDKKSTEVPTRRSVRVRLRLANAPDLFRPASFRPCEPPSSSVGRVARCAARFPICAALWGGKKQSSRPSGDGSCAARGLRRPAAGRCLPHSRRRNVCRVGGLCGRLARHVQAAPHRAQLHWCGGGTVSAAVGVGSLQRAGCGGAARRPCSAAAGRIPAAKPRAGGGIRVEHRGCRLLSRPHRRHRANERPGAALRLNPKAPRPPVHRPTPETGTSLLIRSSTHRSSPLRRCSPMRRPPRCASTAGGARRQQHVRSARLGSAVLVAPSYQRLWVAPQLAKRG